MQRIILCHLVSLQCCWHFFGLESWNVRCNMSHMKSCFWTEKPCKFEGRCHCLCIVPVSGGSNLVYFHLTKAWATPKCFITLLGHEYLELFLFPSPGVGCASELTITTDKNTECYPDICHGCLFCRNEMTDWKTHWQLFFWCLRRLVICYERRVSIYYRFGEYWHRSRGFDVRRCQRFRVNLKQLWATLFFSSFPFFSSSFYSYLTQITLWFNLNVLELFFPYGIFSVS